MQAIAQVNADGTGSVALGDGKPKDVATDGVATTRRQILGIVKAHARRTNRRVEVTAREVDTEYRLSVDPDGTVQSISEPEPQQTAVDDTPTQDTATPSTAPHAEHNPTPKVLTAMTTTDETPRSTSKTAKSTKPTGPTTRPENTPSAAPRARHSFLDDTEPADIADSGWRGFLAGLGLKISPSPQEASRRQDERAVARQWSGPRTIAIVNGKGGAGKTPGAVILSALFARHGGSGVLAWDNNESRGTLGWRTEQGPHNAHLLDLLPSTESLMAPNARASDLAEFVHHQSADKFDVLRSNPEMLAVEQRLTADDFNDVHAVAAKYCRIIIVDSGNDESAAHWLAMIDKADQVVVATTTRPDHAEAGILLLDELRNRSAHGKQLADNAVVIVSQADKEEAAAQRIADGFVGAAREAITVPYDRAMRSGHLQLDQLRPATRRAYLRAAAAVSDGL